MDEVETGSRVRVDIPDQTDPDHDEYHGRHGTVVRVLTDDASRETGVTADDSIYRISFDDGHEADFRRRDLRPPIDED